MKITEYLNYNEEEVLRLYTSVGWSAYTSEPDKLKRGFDNSLLTLAAFENDKLIGLIRIVGDGVTVILIQDILILPEYQRKGIGSALIKEVLERFKEVRQIELFTDTTEKTRNFYKSCGFNEVSEINCLAFTKG